MSAGWQERLALQHQVEKELMQMEPRESHKSRQTPAVQRSVAEVFAPLDGVEETILRIKSQNAWVEHWTSCYLPDDAKVLAARTVSEETACLQQANSRLESELRLQKERIPELEKQVETLLRKSPSPPTFSSSTHGGDASSSGHRRAGN
ncbi:hypothetical protein ACJJTC_003571 [Scirpophaga incertulas]